MSYKIKNGYIYIQYQGIWWLESVLFTIYPELKNSVTLRRV